MTSVAFGLGIAALFALLGCATPGGHSRCVEAAEPATPSPLLWRARSAAAGSGTLYLFGSVHVGASQPVFPEAVERAYASSDELVVEIELDSASAFVLASLMAERGRLEPPTRLQDVLSPDTLTLFERHLSDRGLPLADFEPYEAWYVATLLVASEFAALGFQPDFGVDRHFSLRASDRKLPVRGLETIAQQVEVLDGLPTGAQDLMLADALGSGEHFEQATVALIDAWQRGDEAALARLAFTPEQNDPNFEAFYDALFYRRNSTMAASLFDLQADGLTRFVVLGAGHMVGPEGIPSQLCQRGLRVERISGGG